MSTPSKLAVIRQAKNHAEQLQVEYRLTHTAFVTLFSAFSAVGLHGMLRRRQNIVAHGILAGFFGSMALNEGNLLWRTWDCKPNDPDRVVVQWFGGPVTYRPAQWEVDTLVATEKKESYRLHVDGPRMSYPRGIATFDETFESE